MTSKQGLSRQASDLELSFGYNGHEGDATLVYAFTKDRKELTVFTSLPIEGFKKLGFSAAYENSDFRKTGKALIKYPSQVPTSTQAVMEFIYGP